MSTPRPVSGPSASAVTGMFAASAISFAFTDAWLPAVIAYETAAGVQPS